jgi:hypothetical protein
MDISNGGMASTEYMRVMISDAGKKDRSHLFKQLEEYCGLDSMGMVEIASKLGKMIWMITDKQHSAALKR